MELKLLKHTIITSISITLYPMESLLPPFYLFYFFEISNFWLQINLQLPAILNFKIIRQKRGLTVSLNISPQPKELELWQPYSTIQSCFYGKLPGLKDQKLGFIVYLAFNSFLGCFWLIRLPITHFFILSLLDALAFFVLFICMSIFTMD